MGNANRTANSVIVLGIVVAMDLTCANDPREKTRIHEIRDM